MGKQLCLKTQHGEYILEFDLSAIEKAEQLGVVFSSYDTKTINNTRILFYASLTKNHKTMTQNRANIILDEAIEGGLSLIDIAKSLLEMVGEATSPNEEEGTSPTSTLTKI